MTNEMPGSEFISGRTTWSESASTVGQIAPWPTVQEPMAVRLAEKAAEIRDEQFARGGYIGDGGLGDLAAVVTDLAGFIAVATERQVHPNDAPKFGDARWTISEQGSQS